ncbi:flagellar motor stator protein MotA [Rheinheimera sp.]|uniref:flagellar motor stator protein MotA n=1 Tax=Rheinheimera sp. TaxID=1869214 RepID=UPI003AF5728F
MQRLIGLGVVLLAVVGGFMMAGGNVAMLWQPAEFVIIFGAGLGALVVGNSSAVLKELGQQLKAQFVSQPDQAQLYKELLVLLYQLLETIRTKGFRELEDHVENPQTSSIFISYPAVLDNPQLLQFVCDNVRLMSLGKINAYDLDMLLEQEIQTLEQQQLKPSSATHSIAEAMPGFGILAAVGGIIITMQHLDGPLSSIGYHVAAALVGTFIGIFGCYCLLEPMSNAMEAYVRKQIALLECVRAVLVSHTKGHVAVVATDSGRKMIAAELKPSFTEMEDWINTKAA